MNEELENLSESDEKLREMLAVLKRVEAPKDFEFRLKARIAQADPKSYRPGYRRHFAYGLPASAFAVIAAFVAINGNFFGGSQPTPPLTSTAGTLTEPVNSIIRPEPVPTAVPVEPAPKLAENLPSEAVFTAGQSVQKRKAEIARPMFIGLRSRARKGDEIRRDALGEGSKVEAVSQPTVITPPGIPGTDKKVENPGDFTRDGDIPLKDVISTLGIEIETENGNLKVKSIKQNSQAERAGIKTGDVIETVDGQQVTGETIRGKKIEVKRIGVRRAASQIEINLTGNP